MGDVLFASKVTAPFDVAIVWLQEPLLDIIVPKLASSFKPGRLDPGLSHFRPPEMFFKTPPQINLHSLA